MTLRGAVLADHSACPALADAEAVAQHRDRPAPAGWAYQFPFAISFNATTSSSLSATIRFNRAVPDDQLDATVDALANRIAAWDPQALADAKRVINERVPPPSEGDLLESFSVILAAVARPGAQARLRAMEELGWGSRSDVERDHPAHLVDVAERIAAEVDR
jgi:hypothetical protein